MIFVFLGMAVAHRLKVGFVPIRKKGKLPGELYRTEYSLEYGTDCVEIEKSALTPSDHVVIIDDLLATGGTMKAAQKLVGLTPANLLGCLALIEIDALKGSQGIQNFSEAEPKNFKTFPNV